MKGWVRWGFPEVAATLHIDNQGREILYFMVAVIGGKVVGGHDTRKDPPESNGLWLSLKMDL